MVFSLTQGGVEKVLHNFTTPGGDGANPVAGLTPLNGTLYGTTLGGGAHGGGTVFRISLNGAENILHSFGKGYDGSQPMAGLIAVDGMLYGTTSFGGQNGRGTVFRVSTSGKEKVLHSFGAGSDDGLYPQASLIYANGTLYGTTLEGGTHRYYNGGTVFKVTTTGRETVIYSFGTGRDLGLDPESSLVATGGLLYGTTNAGGAYRNGIVFSLTKAGKNYKVLHSFNPNGSDGTSPKAGLIAVNGKLYGTTAGGGSSAYCIYGCGVVYSITATGDENILHRFGTSDPNDGAFPQANLINVNGLLYGTTPLGGISPPSCFNSGGCHWGTVFAIKP